MALNTRQWFADECRAYGVSRAARALGCSRQYLYALMDDRKGKLPGLALANAIQTVLKIPTTAWDHLNDGKAA